MNLPDFLTQDSLGEIRLTGHRISLYTVLRYYRNGLSPEEIGAELPSLPLDLINQALRFYRENSAEVNAYMESCGAEIVRQEAQPPRPGVLKVRELLEKRGCAETTGPKGTA